MRHGCHRGILLLALLYAPIHANAADVGCLNSFTVDYQPFPAGTVEWEVSKTKDPQDASDELTVDVLANHKIDGSTFVHARVYIGEKSEQNFDLMTSGPYRPDPLDEQSLVVLLSFGTSEQTDNTVVLKFAYHSKIPCPDQITIYELPLSVILGANIESEKDGK